LELQRVARIEPSLQSIFIDTVGRDNMAEEEANDSAPPPPRLTTKDPRVRKQFINMLIYFVVTVILGLNLRHGFDPVMGIFVLLGLSGTVWSFVKFQKARRQVGRELLDEEVDA
ncbi:MAG: hypothetical protein C0600_11280, partial [Ignavibacteria bacterium]